MFKLLRSGSPLTFPVAHPACTYWLPSLVVSGSSHHLQFLPCRCIPISSALDQHRWRCLIITNAHSELTLLGRTWVNLCHYYFVPRTKCPSFRHKITLLSSTTRDVDVKEDKMAHPPQLWFHRTNSNTAIVRLTQKWRFIVWGIISWSHSQGNLAQHATD